MTALSDLSAEYLIVGAAVALLLGAFVMLLLVPSQAAYGRYWEKFVAAALSIYVLVVLIAVGVGVGVVVVYYWDTITKIF